MKTIVANWKMNLGIRESVAQARGVLRAIQGRETLPTIVLCPSFTALAEVRKVTVRSHVSLGAQNVGPERDGAFTGEVSGQQLDDIGCTHIIVGHSERRATFGENDDLVADRVKAAFTAGLTPIVCVGESREERDAGDADRVVAAQVMRAVRGVAVPKRASVLFAYEPVWAVGTGTSAEPADAIVMHRVITAAAVESGLDLERVSVLYGGSVDGKNAYSFLREPEVGGVLVGAASLKMHEFESVIAAACDVIDAQSL